MFAAALVVLFIVVPIAELYVIIQVGGAIGVLPTVALLLLDSLLGAFLLKWQGGAAWRRFTDTLRAGRASPRPSPSRSAIRAPACTAAPASA